MKSIFNYFLFLIFCVVTPGCYTFGKGGETETRRATGLVIHTSDDADTAYRRLAGLLVDRGYSLAETDNVLYSITTDWRATSRGQVRVRAMVREGEGVGVTIRGDVVLNINVGKSLLGQEAREDAPTPISEVGMKGSPAREAWEELEAIAASYGGDVEKLY